MEYKYYKTSHVRMSLTLASDSIPPTAATKYKSWSGEVFSARHDSPTYKLADIIPVIVTNVITEPKTKEAEQEKEHQSLATKLFKNKDDSKNATSTTKTVFMLRSEYLKWFATDEHGTYVGTEPKKRWTEKELDDVFGSFRPKINEKRDVVFIDRLITANARGF